MGKSDLESFCEKSETSSNFLSQDGGESAPIEPAGRLNPIRSYNERRMIVLIRGWCLRRWATRARLWFKRRMGIPARLRFERRPRMANQNKAGQEWPNYPGKDAKNALHTLLV